MIETIINNFKNYIQRKRLTQIEAAEILNISQAHMSRIINGKRVPSMTLLKRMEEVMRNG